MDLTDLETFGELATNKTSKVHKLQIDKDADVQSEKCASSQPVKKSNRSSELPNKSSSSLEVMNTDIDDHLTVQTVQPLNESQIQDCAQESDEHLASTGESDEDDDKLVIDDYVSPFATPTTQHAHNTASSSITTVSDTIPEKAPLQKRTKRIRQSKQSKAAGDQLGEILRMQTAMFKSASDTAKCSTMCPETNPSTPKPASTVHSHQTSLVKPCVTSYLERTQKQDDETGAGPLQSTPVNVVTTEHKR